MTDTMEYKGYIARIEYDGSSKLFYGIVQNIRDVVHFEGSSAAELEEAFRDSVEAYREFSDTCGDAPQVPATENFRIELPPALRERVTLSAARSGKSVETFLKGIVQDWYDGEVEP